MTKNWDVDKVRKVLERKAVVRAVDVEPLASSSSYSISSLEVDMAAMNVGGPTHGNKKASERKCLCTEILEESMGTMINKVSGYARRCPSKDGEHQAS